MRILDIINSTTTFLEKKGVESPRLQIELLLAHLLSLKRLDLYLQFERELSDGELEPLREMVKKRASGTPLQHITGMAPFYGRDFIVSPDVLIPRPETEQLVEIALSKLRGLIEEGETRRLRGLDLCTGSGIISITMSLEWDALEMTSTDISPKALQIARKNAEKLLPDPSLLKLIESDLFHALSGSFDFIITNPPYIPSNSIPGLSKEVQFDPLIALDGGQDGMEIINQICGQLPSFLSPRGWFFVEIGHDQGQRVNELLKAKGMNSVEIFKDMNGFDRIAIGQMS